MERSEKKNINGKAHRVQGAGSVDVLPSGKHRVRVKVKGRRVADVFATAEEAEALRQCPPTRRRGDSRWRCSTVARSERGGR